MKFDIPLLAKALIALAIAAAIYGAIVSYGNGRYEAGKQAEKAAWTQRENAELVTANAEIVRLNAQARKDEQDHGAAMAKASGTYQESLKNEKAAHARTVADLRSGAIELRIELARRKSADGGSSGTPGAGAGGCDGAAYGELSPAASGFLVGLASEADEVVHQLTACQAVVTADRQIQSQGEK